MKMIKIIEKIIEKIQMKVTNYPANKYMLKANNRKKGLMSLWVSLNIFHTLF